MVGIACPDFSGKNLFPIFALVLVNSPIVWTHFWWHSFMI